MADASDGCLSRFALIYQMLKIVNGGLARSHTNFPVQTSNDVKRDLRLFFVYVSLSLSSSLLYYFQRVGRLFVKHSLLTHTEAFY